MPRPPVVHRHESAVDTGAEAIDITGGDQHVIGGDYDRQARQRAVKKGVLLSDAAEDGDRRRPDGRVRQRWPGAVPRCGRAAPPRPSNPRWR
ncbi:hypothetical protein [Streptomyces sp. SudanB182_2057]|uniref:hypothetical protein n=1 Tax=Streptomyces sp. SudanB182_2057 TaxID=3035281 RepID=UPI003F54B07C